MSGDYQILHVIHRLVAKTTTGCIFGGSCNGSKNESAEKSGKKAADEIIQSIKNGGCVDNHMQDQVRLIVIYIT